jgi:protein-S-isoprenylcysteine O-methyltransferase Ste14
MQRMLGAVTLGLLPMLVVMRVLLLKRKGTEALQFGKKDKRDFLIPPFALFYFYTVFGAAFGWRLASRQVFFASGAAAWVGVALCLGGLAMLGLTLIEFGRSFRVGIDAERPDALVTTGIFAVSRNPIYVAFGFVLLGEFLAFPNWILLVYLGAGVWLLNRQVRLEESFLKQHYGQQYLEYCARVRRYL